MTDRAMHTRSLRTDGGLENPSWTVGYVAEDFVLLAAGKSDPCPCRSFRLRSGRELLHDSHMLKTRRGVIVVTFEPSINHGGGLPVAI